MKRKKLSLWVYDESQNEFTHYPIPMDITKMTELFLAFQKQETNEKFDVRGWKAVFLCDKNENIILGFRLESLFQYGKKKKAQPMQKFFGCLSKLKVRLGDFVVRDQESYQNLVLHLLRIVRDYIFERQTKTKTVAKANLLRAVNLLYEYAFLNSVELLEEKVQEANIPAEKFNLILKKSLLPIDWRRCLHQRDELQSDWENEMHQVFAESISSFMQAKPKNLQQCKLNFENALNETRNRMIQKEMEASYVEDVAEKEKEQIKQSYLTYLNEKFTESYWLWQSFLLAKTEYPRAYKGLNDIFTDEMLYQKGKLEAYKPWFLQMQTQYFAFACKISQEEIAETLKQCIFEVSGKEQLDEEKMQQKMNRPMKRVYQGYHNLLKRYHFFEEYGDLIFVAYGKYLNLPWQNNFLKRLQEKIKL